MSRQYFLSWKLHTCNLARNVLGRKYIDLLQFPWTWYLPATSLAFFSKTVDDWTLSNWTTSAKHVTNLYKYQCICTLLNCISKYQSIRCKVIWGGGYFFPLNSEFSRNMVFIYTLIESLKFFFILKKGMNPISLRLYMLDIRMVLSWVFHNLTQ